jgi:hypothetical protein
VLHRVGFVLFTLNGRRYWMRRCLEPQRICHPTPRDTHALTATVLTTTFQPVAATQDTRVRSLPFSNPHSFAGHGEEADRQAMSIHSSAHSSRLSAPLPNESLTTRSSRRRPPNVRLLTTSSTHPAPALTLILLFLMTFTRCCELTSTTALIRIHFSSFSS